MSVLATDRVRVEGQTAATAGTQGASSAQGTPDFAAELSTRLEVKPNTTDQSHAIVTGGAQGIKKPSEDGDQGCQAPGRPAGSQNVTAARGSLHRNTDAKDNTPSNTTLIEVAAFHLTSTSDGAPPSAKLPAPSAVSVAPKEPAANSLRSLTSVDPTKPQGKATSLADPKLTTPDDSLPAVSRAFSTQSRPPQHSAVTQIQPAGTMTIVEQPAGAVSTVPSCVSNLSKPAEVEPPAQSHDPLAQSNHSQIPNGADRKPEASQSKNLEDPALTQTPKAVVGPTSRSLSPAKTTASEQRESADVAALASDQTRDALTTRRIESSEGTEGPDIATLSTSQCGIAGRVPLTPSRKPAAASDLTTVSHSRNDPGSALSQTSAWSDIVPTPSRVQGAPDAKDPSDTKNSNGPNSAQSISAIKTAAALGGATTGPELQNNFSVDNANSGAPQQKGSMPSSRNQGRLSDADPELVPSGVASGLTSKQARAHSAGDLNVSPIATVTGIESSHPDGDLENAATQLGVANQLISGRGVGAKAPVQWAATDSEPQARTGSPQTTEPRQVPVESAVGSCDPLVPSDDEIISLSVVPNYLVDNKPASSLDGGESVTSGRAENCLEVTSTQQGSGGNAPPISMPNSFAQAPVQPPDDGANPPARDTGHPEAGGQKNDADALRDPTKDVDAKPDLPKTTPDSHVAPQISVQGPPQTDRAAPQIEAESQDHAESANTIPPAGYQTGVHEALGSARLNQQAGSAEMQVRLRFESLGPIDVRTVVRGSDIGASIHVEARETQMIMANELSRLEQALSERSLRVQRLDVLQGSVSGGESSGAGPGNYHGSTSQHQQGSGRYTVAETYPDLPETLPVYDEGSLGLSTARINLRV